MRARAFVLFLLVAMLAGAGASHSSGRIDIRRALTPEQAAEQAKRGTPWRGPVMDANATHGLVERARRDRIVPHKLAPPGFDWRDDAHRAHPGRNPNTPVPANAAPAAVSAAPPETIHVAFIRIDFLHDRAGDETSGNGKFDLTGPDTSVAPIDRPPHDRTFYEAHAAALQRYYDAQSYGRVVVVADVWPKQEDAAYHCNDMADFGKWRFSQDVYGQAVRMMRDMFFAADTQSTQMGDRIPWDSYQRFDLIHAGSDFQSDIRGDSPYDIPSFTLGVSDTDVVVFRDSTNVPIDRATIVPETVNQDGYFATLNGVLAHENGHNMFGFADLYDIETGYPVVGYWSLMDSGNLAGSQVQLPNGEIIYAVGLLPPSVDPFQRFFTTDALEFRDVAWGDTTALRNSERFPDVRRLWMTSDEYLLIENRAILAGDTLELDQDSTTKVILGPKAPDRFEYDALLPGSGTLVWHIDASVIPFDTSPRINSDYGWNTNPARLGVEVIEADRLDDLGDPGSPFILGAPYDPWFVGNNTTLADSTIPPMKPHIKTLPHARLDVLDVPGATMRILARRTWERSGWPVAADVPPEGPELLAVDADGDGQFDVCWAGGGGASSDSAAIFAVRPNGQGLFDPTTYAFATLDARPLQPLAALGQGPGGAAASRSRAARSARPGAPSPTPALFAATTRITGNAGSPGGQVWLIDHTGSPVAGWPVTLPTAASTPPVVDPVTSRVYVGAVDGYVYALDLTGAQVWRSPDALAGPVRGRIALWTYPQTGIHFVAAGDGDNVAVWGDGTSPAITWHKALSVPPSEPDFLWLPFDRVERPAGAALTCNGSPTLVVHEANRLWAFCGTGEPLAGWGHALPDTLLPGLAAGDVDHDGYPEVIAQTRRSGVVYFNQSGAPSPGWPEATTREHLPAGMPMLAVDVDGDGAPEMVGGDGSGRLNALRPDTKQPAGWPLGLGAEAAGAAVAGDLDGDGMLDIVAPDRPLPDSLQFGINGRFSSLHAWSVGSAAVTALATPWPMLGHDPGRSSMLPSISTPVAPAIAGGPYVNGSLKAYPNPAKQKPVAFAFQLTEPARVDVDIVDTSGHKVAGFGVDGLQSDNVAVWDPGRLPAGLYLARLRFRGASGEHSEVIQVGVIR